MRIKSRRTSFMIILLLAALYASAFAEPRLVPDSRLTVVADTEGNMDSDTFARLALVVSGTNDQNMDALSEQLSSLSNELGSGLSPDADDRSKAEAILGLMYKKTLSRYSEFQTQIDTALVTGDYNCVSSAVIFYYLAKTAGLKVEGVETPNHAFCTVEIDGRKTDVETTNPYGFDPGSKKELAAQKAAQKAYVIVSQTKYQHRKPIDERRLLALVYENRIALLEKNGNYEQAVGLVADAWQLQNKTVPIEYMAKIFLNYALSLSASGNDAAGIAFIQKVSPIWGDYAGYQNYTASAVGKMVNALMKKNDYPGSFQLLSSYKDRLDPQSYTKMNRGITVNYLHYTIDSLPLDKSLAKLAASRYSLDSADYEKLATYAYSREADRISKSGAWLEAVQVLDEGLKILPGQSKLLQQKKIYRENYAVEVHNRAVDAYNAKNFDGLKSLLQNGLTAIPESELLRNDLKMIE